MKISKIVNNSVHHAIYKISTVQPNGHHATDTLRGAAVASYQSLTKVCVLLV